MMKAKTRLWVGACSEFLLAEIYNEISFSNDFTLEEYVVTTKETIQTTEVTTTLEATILPTTASTATLETSTTEMLDTVKATTTRSVITSTSSNQKKLFPDYLWWLYNIYYRRGF